ncbi:MAG: TRZ/ATZ family hydrolase [Gammaproteobacteria bacterium]
MEKVDTLINARWVIPVAPDCVPREHCSLVLHHGRILDLLPETEARARYDAREIIERPTHALIPGLVNSHTHAAMSLLRGLADDLPLMEWLKNHIWPVERQWVGPEFVADGSELAIAEMLRGGTTCFNDMYFFPDVTARTAARLGIRACVGLIVLDHPSAWAESAAEYLSKGLVLADEYKGHPLISCAFAPHAPYTVGDETLVKVRKLSDELELPIHTHLHETADEIKSSVSAFGERPLARFARLGLMTPLLQAVHMTQLYEAEIQAAARAGINVVHAPQSNMKLASGACPVESLLAAGINVSLGTDGAASNNDLDMLSEMHTASLLAKHVAANAQALDAPASLRMATLNGAEALGLGEVTGSLEAGKWADITCIDLAPLNTQPVYDPVAQIVYSANRDQVSDVWVGGRQQLSGGRLTRIDTDDLAARAAAWGKRIGSGEEESN